MRFLNFLKRDDCVKATKSGTVTEVQLGVVVVDEKRYEGLQCTLVQPGQVVSKGQAIGRKKR